MNIGKALSIIIIIITNMISFGQRPTMELTFTAVDNTSWIQLDSIKVINRTQGSESMICWPDTTISLAVNPGDLLLFAGYSTFSGLGVHEWEYIEHEFQLFQNYPNPVNDHCMVSLHIPAEGIVSIKIADTEGRIIISADQFMSQGYHTFRFTPGEGQLYILSANYKGRAQSIKIIKALPEKRKTSRLDYIGRIEYESLMQVKSKEKGIVKESGILDSPESSKTYTFQFATNIPCPGIPTVEYEGQVYNTIQIFSQCWLKENLNVGNMIHGTLDQSDNGIIEKYCYNNNLDTCAKYGGFYQWNEMMQYASQQGARGICPPGWHLPTDEEWKLLEGAVDSQYGIGDTIWDLYGSRGYDAGKNLKSVINWYSPQGTDLYGFTALPGGGRFNYNPGSGLFVYKIYVGLWWTSSYPWHRNLQSSFGLVTREYLSNNIGLSVRCLKD